MAPTPDGSATTEATTYEYNVQGKMSAMTDPAGNAWSWGFDVLGRQVTATDPDTGTTTSTYDDTGNLLTSTDARGVTLAYTYDELNRRTAEYHGTTSGAKLASWTNDTVAKGQPTGSTSYVGSTPGTPGSPYSSTVTGYDDLYDPTGTTVSLPADAPGFGATTFTTSATYKVDGKIATETLPAMGGLPSETLRYGYDMLANVHSLAGTKTYSTVTYTAIGQVAQLNRELSAELYTTFGYDPATGAVNEIEDTAVTTGPYTVEADRHYTRNDAGDVTGINTTGAAGVDTQCFSYDYLHDLTQAWTPADNSCAAAPSATNIGGAAPYWTGYTIDPATGNRSQVVHNPTTASGPTVTDTYGYPDAGSTQPHAVQHVSHTGGAATDGYAYDAAGNTTARPGQTLTYNAIGKTSTITTSAVTQQNIYDASGALLLQSDPTGGTTLFLKQTQLHVAAASTTATAVRTYMIGGTPVAERSTADGTSGSTLVWISGDANHTQDLEVDSSTGTLIRRFADPYGNSRGTAAEWSSDHGYLNKPADVTTGLAQLGARAYDSLIGRFLSVDSILAPGNPQQNNGYAYSANDPITNADPSGACWVGSSDSFNFHTTCSSGAKSNTGAPVITYNNVAAKGPDHGHVQDLNQGATNFSRNPFCNLVCSIEHPEEAKPVTPPVTHSNSPRTRPGAYADELAKRDSLVPTLEPLDKGTGVYGSVTVRAIGGASFGVCSVRTLDGQTHTAVTVGIDAGIGEDVIVSGTLLTTNAKDVDGLNGGDFGFHGAAAYGAGVTMDRGWSATDPRISSSEAGFGIGEGIYLGAGYRWTTAW